MNTFRQSLALPKKKEHLYVEVTEGQLKGRVGIVRAGVVNFAAQNVLDPETDGALTVVHFPVLGKQYAIPQTHLKQAEAPSEGN